MGGKSGGVTGYKYYFSIHMGVCRGPVDQLVEVKVDDKKAWPRETTIPSGSGNFLLTAEGILIEQLGSSVYATFNDNCPVTESKQITINAPDLFGGEDKEGGIVGKMDVMMGEPMQVAPSALSSMLGGLVSGFRGMLTLFYDGLVATNNPYPKLWKFRVRRALKGWDGDTFFPEKCVIGMASDSQSASEGYVNETDFPALTSTVDTEFTYDPGPERPAGDWEILIENFSYTSSDSTVANNILRWNSPYGGTAFWIYIYLYGTAGQLFVSIGGGPGIAGPNAPNGDIKVTYSSATNLVSLYVANVLIGTCDGGPLTNPSTSAGSVVIGDGPGYYTVPNNYQFTAAHIRTGGTVSGLLETDIYAMNPSHMIYQCLTDRNWGRGFPREILDETSFTDAANALCCEGFGLCMKWMREDDVTVFIQTVLDHIGAVLFPSRETGLITLRLIRDNYDASALPVYSTANGLLSIQADDASTSETLYNEVVVSYVDPITGNERQTRVQNIGAMQASGAIFSKSVSYPGIPTPGLAARVAQRELRVHGTPLRRFKLYFDRRGYQIEPGAVFKIQSTERGIGSTILRAGKVVDGADGKIEVTAVQDIFGLPDASYVSFVPPVAGVNRDPLPAIYQDIQEASYIDLLRNLSSSDISALAADDSFVVLMGGRPSAFAIDFKMLTNVDGSPSSDKGTGTWAPFGLLSANIEPLDSLVTLTNVDLGDTITVGSAAYIGDEVVQISSWDEDTLVMGILRGCADTVPASHPSGTPVFNYYNGAGYDPTVFVDGETVEARLLTVAYGGVLSANLATEMTTDIAVRRHKPYPPGQVKVNGSEFPAIYVAGLPITLTFVNRNRLTQADVLVSHAASNVTPEAGTAYTVRVLSGLTVLRSESVSDSPWEYSYAEWVSDGSPMVVTIELYTTRDGLNSWQKYVIPLSIGGVEPPVGSLAFTGYAPTAINSGNFVPLAVGSLSFTGHPPAVINTGAFISLPPGALRITGHAPTVTTSSLTGIPQGQLAYTGYAPTVSQTNMDAFYENVVLLLHGEGTHGSTTIVDSSIYNRDVTIVGSVSISTSSPLMGSASIQNNPAGGSYYRVELGDDGLMTGDFTIEMMLQGGYNNIVFYSETGGGYLYNNGFQSYGGPLVGLYLVDSVPIRVAISRIGTTIRTFRDGALWDTQTYAGTVDLRTLRFGMYIPNNNGHFPGKYDEVRITKGVGRYDSSYTILPLPFEETPFPSPRFVPQRARLTYTGYAPTAVKSNIIPQGALTFTGRAPKVVRSDDPHFENVILLLHADEESGSTFLDSSLNKTVTTVGGTVVVSTAEKKFGPSSIFPAAGFDQYVRAAGAIFSMPGEYTIECFFYYAGNGVRNIFDYGYDEGGGNEDQWMLNTTIFQGGDLVLWAAGLNRVTTTPPNLMTVGWHHIAVTRDASNFIALWKDGVFMGGYTASGSGVAALRIGGSGPYNNGSGYYLDEVRVTRGVCRYTENFDVPTVAFPGLSIMVPPAGSLAFAGYAPTPVNSGSFTAPAVGLISISGQVPTVVIVNPVIPNGTLSFTGYAPTIQQSDGIEYLIVAGGGSGSDGVSNVGGGGGGAGGMRQGSVFAGPATEVITVTVGAGGTRALPGNNGNDSSISGSGIGTVTAIAGGRGGFPAGGNGGSGGGAAGATTGFSGTPVAGTGTAGQGNNGALGTGQFGNSVCTGGGGGGAGGAPTNGTLPGGVGLASNITGGSVTYAAGGAGGSNSGGAGSSGAANTGNGGGGGAGNSQQGGNGGSGIVVLRIPTSSYTGIYTGSPTITVDGSHTVLKFTANGSYTAGAVASTGAGSLSITGRAPSAAISEALELPDAFGVYSLYRLVSAATNCLRVCRSSDNAEQDIGFVNDYIDTAALSSFVGGGDGYVSVWYDQSGKGNDLAQGGANTSRPYVYAGGVFGASVYTPTNSRWLQTAASRSAGTEATCIYRGGFTNQQVSRAIYMFGGAPSLSVAAADSGTNVQTQFTAAVYITQGQKTTWTGTNKDVWADRADCAQAAMSDALRQYYQGNFVANIGTTGSVPANMGSGVLSLFARPAPNNDSISTFVTFIAYTKALTDTQIKNISAVVANPIGAARTSQGSVAITGYAPTVVVA